MSRRKNTEEVKTEVVNEEVVDNISEKNSLTEELSGEDITPEESEVKEPAKPSSSSKKSSSVPVSYGDLHLITRVAVLERTFTRKYRELAIYEVWGENNILLLKDRNGKTVNTSKFVLADMMRFFLARQYPVESRPRGTTYSWVEVK